VRDGPSWAIDQLIGAVKRELEALAKDEFRATYKETPGFNAAWNLRIIDQVVRNALDDHGVDIVLAMGLLVTDAAARKDLELSKPVLGGLILDADISGLHCTKEACSGKKNFSFVVSSLRVFHDLEAYKKLVDFKRLHVIADGKLIEGTKSFGGAFDRLGKELDFTPVLVPADTGAEEVLGKLGNDVQAVYLTPPLRMSRSEKQALIDGINEKKIPSFSLRGLPDVESGVLAGIAPRTTQLLARRLALNLQRIVGGEPPDRIPVYLTLKEQLALNAMTAAEIGYSPDFETMMTAEFLHADALEKGEPLNLQQAMEIAAEQNIDLAIRAAEVQSSKQDRNKAFSLLLPQVGGDTGYERVDKDRAEASLGQLPEWKLGIGFELNQILFDDATLSEWRSSKRTYRQRRYEEDNLRLDIMELAAKRYLDYLSAKMILKIEMENLRLTKTNLDLARVRYRVGKAGREEVYRWEAQLSRNKSAVLLAQSVAESTRVALNQTLGTDQDRLWKARDIVLADDDFYFLNNRLAAVIGNEAELEHFRQFAVDDAFKNSPALMAVGQAIDAQAITLNQLKRKFVAPSLDGFFTFDHAMHRHRVMAPNVPQRDLYLPDTDDWLLGAVATLPLFQGGGRFFDVYRAKADLDQLTSTKERIRQLIEQQTLTAIYNIESSHPNIRLSRQAADAAHKNLEIVQEKYAQGLVSILDLLDAQNQALAEDRAAAIAVYEYLKRLYEFQRAISWFQDFKTEEERDEWTTALNTYIQEQMAKKSGTS
jgi:outer membrane protein